MSWEEVREGARAYTDDCEAAWGWAGQLQTLTAMAPTRPRPPALHAGHRKRLLSPTYASGSETHPHP